MHRLHLLTAAQYAQVILTCMFMAVIVATAVYASTSIRRSEPIRSQIIIVTQVTCGSFHTPEQAMAMYVAIPGDPFGLDGDGDGRPCEALQ